jgi:hypothetical protein
MKLLSSQELPETMGTLHQLLPPVLLDVLLGLAVRRGSAVGLHSAEPEP